MIVGFESRVKVNGRQRRFKGCGEDEDETRLTQGGLSLSSLVSLISTQSSGDVWCHDTNQPRAKSRDTEVDPQTKPQDSKDNKNDKRLMIVKEVG